MERQRTSGSRPEIICDRQRKGQRRQIVRTGIRLGNKDIDVRILCLQAVKALHCVSGPLALRKNAPEENPFILLSLSLLLRGIYSFYMMITERFSSGSLKRLFVSPSATFFRRSFGMPYLFTSNS